MLDLEKLAATELHSEPYEYLIVEDLLRPECKEAIVRDFPGIDRSGSFPLASLKYGEAFALLSAELFSQELLSDIAGLVDLVHTRAED